MTTEELPQSTVT